VTPPDPPVSVVIPGHATRRWPQLLAAVESVRAQSPAPARIVVAVDHNEELLARARRELTGVTVVANVHPPGAAGNRNTGIAATDTPVVALLDDDVTARPGWLAGLLAPLRADDVIGTGGTIVPRWARARPSWFPDELLWAVAATHGEPGGDITVRNVWSASMVLRRDAFEAAGAFRIGFAPRGDGTGLEDTDLCVRMSRATGGRWVHVPGAVVDHAVPAERATLRYLVGRCYREGRGKVQLARMLGGPRILHVERAYLRGAVAWAVLRGLGRALRGRGAAHAAQAFVLLAGMSAAFLGGLAGICGPGTGRYPLPAMTLPRLPVPEPAAPAGGVRE
jgi:GT2 family glycosyltransferase